MLKGFGVGDRKKPHQWSHTVDTMHHPMKIVIARLWRCYLTDLHASSNLIGRKKSIPYLSYHYSLHMVTYVWLVLWFYQISHDTTYQFKEASERSDFNQICVIQGHSQLVLHCHPDFNSHSSIKIYAKRKAVLDKKTKTINIWQKITIVSSLMIHTQITHHNIAEKLLHWC